MGLSSTLFVYGLVAVASYTLYGLFWRLFLSPIAKIPGPKLAAATFWYEFYYDVVKGGQYVYQIEKMHQQYGKKPSQASAGINLTQHRTYCSYQPLRAQRQRYGPVVHGQSVPICRSQRG